MPAYTELARTERVAPRTQLEQQLLYLWAEALGRRDFGVDDNVFQLGAHSLLVARVAAGLWMTLGVEVPIHKVYEGRTVAILAQTIAPLVGERRANALPVDQPRRSAATPVPRSGGHDEAVADEVILGEATRYPQPPILPRPAGAAIPLSYQQQALWFLDQIAPGQAAYNVPLAMRIVGPLDLDRLRQALRTVVERHETIRTVVSPGPAGNPVQQLLSSWELPFTVFDLRDVEADRREDELREATLAEARRPYDLTSDLMLRVVVLRVSDEEQVLLLNLHHIVFDGWSIRLLYDELAELYAALTLGRSSALEELPIQYADWAVWQHEQLQGSALEDLQSYWRATLDGAPRLLALPTDHPRPPVLTFAGTHQRFEIPGVGEDAVRELAGAEAATPFMVLVAASVAGLHRWSGHDDFVLGSPIAGRDHPDTQNVIGLFANTLVLRIQTAGRPTLRELVRRTRQVAIGAYEHQELPFEKLVEAIAPQRDPSANPIFQVNVRVRTASSSRFTLPEVEIQPFHLDAGSSRFDLAIDLTIGESGVEGYIEYNEALFLPRTIRRLVSCLRRLVVDALRRPDEPIGALNWEDTSSPTPIVRR